MLWDGLKLDYMLTSNQGVGGSNPSGRTMKSNTYSFADCSKRPIAVIIAVINGGSTSGWPFAYPFCTLSLCSA